MTYVAAIILGHLKMPVTQFKRALLAMDEKLLSSELLTQILAYAPDHKEVREASSSRSLHTLLITKRYVRRPHPDPRIRS